MVLVVLGAGNARLERAGGGADGAGGADEARRGDDLDLVDARQQVREEVLAVGIRGQRGDHGADTVEQVDADAGDAGLARIADAVVVGVVEDLVADGQRRGEAEVGVKVGRAGRRGGDGGDADAAGVDAVGVGGGVATLQRRRDLRAGQRAAGAVVGGVVDADGVAGRAGHDRGEVVDGAGRRGAQGVGEGVVAVGVGEGGADEGAGGVVQVDGDAGDAGLAVVLDAVAVDVPPDEVADGDRRGEAEVEGQVGAARGGGGDGGLAEPPTRTPLESLAGVLPAALVGDSVRPASGPLV